MRFFIRFQKLKFLNFLQFSYISWVNLVHSTKQILFICKVVLFLRFQNIFYILNQPLFFIFWEIFVLFATMFSFFVFVFVQKDLDTFHEPFFEGFLCFLFVFDFLISSGRLYIQENMLHSKLIVKNACFKKLILAY